MYGAEIRGSSPGEGLKKSAEAFYVLIDRVKKKHPDMKIENCGSGAMRSDNGTLRHFELQSTSDQEFYDLNPSIASGYAACIMPEKAGIWALSLIHKMCIRDRSGLIRIRYRFMRFKRAWMSMRTKPVWTH